MGEHLRLWIGLPMVLVAVIASAGSHSFNAWMAAVAVAGMLIAFGGEAWG